MKKRRFSQTFRESCLIVAEQVYGRKGVWAYERFVFINDLYFAGRLPWPHILWGLTAHGDCVAWASTARDKSRPPIITLHPSLLRGTEKEEPWEYSRGLARPVPGLRHAAPRIYSRPYRV